MYIHLPDDVKKYENLDTFSAFQFEIFMYYIKKMLHKHNLPLAQVCNRIAEMQQSNYIRLKEKDQSYPLLKKKEVTSESKTIFRKVILQRFSVDNSVRNQWLLTKNNEIVCFEHAEIWDSEIYIYIWV